MYTKKHIANRITFINLIWYALYNSIYNNLSMQVSKTNTRVSGVEYKLDKALLSYSAQIEALSGSISNNNDYNELQLDSLSGLIDKLSIL